MSNVHHPDHYQGKYECIDEMVAMFGVEAVKTWCRLNVYKYRFRAGAKAGAEDIRKAEEYVGILAKLEGLELKTAEQKRAEENARCCYNCKHEHLSMDSEPCCSCVRDPEPNVNFVPKED